MASDPLDGVIEALATTLGGLEGLEHWYAAPPENLMEFPCGMAYLGDGTLEAAATGAKGIHRIIIAILQCRPVLPDAIAAVRVWPYRVLTALQADQTLGGSVAAIVWPMTYRAGPIQWTPNEAPYYGVRFELQVKVLS